MAKKQVKVAFRDGRINKPVPMMDGKELVLPLVKGTVVTVFGEQDGNARIIVGGRVGTVPLDCVD